MKPVCFSASRSSDLISQGTGRTQMSYCFDLALRSIDAEKDITTSAMLHGINNEVRGLEIAERELSAYPNIDPIKGTQIFYPINDYLGATPDFIGDDFVGDIKCQYSIYNYVIQGLQVPKKYYVQVQCQMMALKVDKGYLLNYLTKPEKWGDDEWIEYPFSESQRYKIHEIKKDDQIQSDLLEAAEKWFPYIGMAQQMLISATVLNDEEFFYPQLMDGVKFLKLKETNWINNDRQVLRHENEFYVIK